MVQETFSEQLRHAKFEDFYRAINAVKPSLIRVEADELTYNLHIMVRFEIELDLIEGRAQVEDLPTIWNQKMQEYLGISPNRDADGVLQDVHWSFGAFGCFPTYTLGNLYASMFYAQAKKDLPDLESEIGNGTMLPLKTWLNQKVHRWGRQYMPEDLLRQVTGQFPTPEPFLAYLEEKYCPLYGLPIGPQE